jgi:uncharacterized protein YoxC
MPESFMSNISFVAIIPIAISIVSLALAVYTMKKKAERNLLDDMERRIDMASSDIQNYKRKLKECEQRKIYLENENDTLRHDKIALLEKLVNRGIPPPPLKTD